MSGNVGIVEEIARELLSIRFREWRGRIDPHGTPVTVKMPHGASLLPVFGRDVFALTVWVEHVHTKVEIPSIVLAECRSHKDWVKLLDTYVEPAMLRLALSTWEV